MSSKFDVVKILTGLLIAAAISMPRISFADWSVGIGIGDDHGYHDRGEHGYYGWHDHPHYGWHLHYLPVGAYSIWVEGVRYYYYDGLYYQYIGNGDYVLVNPPYGAYVSAIPPDFQPVLINGRTYYADNGVYYVLTPHGYRVVHQPDVYSPAPAVVYAQPQQVVVSQPAPVADQGSFPVNIPNNSGGYTTVVIKQSGSGYVGPQGEFYQTFPSVAQLKAMYSK